MVAIVAALAILGGGALVVLDDDGGGEVGIGPDDGVRHRLELPQLSGRFNLMQTHSEEVNQDAARAMGLRTEGGAAGLYRDTALEDEGDAGDYLLSFRGRWGEVQDPERAAALWLGLIAEDLEEADLVGAGPSSFTDEDVAVECQLARDVEPNADAASAPDRTLCVWADYSTMGSTYFLVNPDHPDVEPLSPAVAAALTKRFREDALREINGGA
ncbi:hypothetical protein [Streptomyces sp. B6B3]|uniref:hypothetical protein n=1 Tax=Streptomyces sp. B6B3 TaxID=3153570 RepID=UPI00325DFAF3